MLTGGDRRGLTALAPVAYFGALASQELEPMYRATTRAIQVTVEPSFVEEESSPEDGRYFWAYTIEIANLGDEVVRLRSRHWRITDANGRTEEVRGAGVVGKQPVLKPGETFAYTSGCPLDDAVRHHGRHLPDAEREGRAVLDRHSGVLARPARRRPRGELALTDG